jgi:tRNA threonylcarbamoyladenosine biosynthesis protein TsaB
MILLLNTSAPVCKLTFIDGDNRIDDEWQSDRMLAKGLLGYIDELLKKHHKSWSDISAIGAFEGPGSFTGIRIGLTVVNTIADAQNIPIVGARGGDWQNKVLAKIDDGQNEKIVLPFYGSEANITIPRK